MSKFSKTKSGFQHAITCYDCGAEVHGSIKEHHKICPKSRLSKSIIDFPAQAQQLAAPSDKKVSPSTTSDVYFILDVSSSMEGKRLNEAKRSILKMSEKLDIRDRIALITFDDKAFFKLHPHPVEKILRQNELPGILDKIFARGQTALYDAIKLSIDQIRDKSKRVIFNVLTDGEDNSSNTGVDELKRLLNTYPNIRINFVEIGKESAAYKMLCHNIGIYSPCNDGNAFQVYMDTFSKLYSQEEGPPPYVESSAPPAYVEQVEVKSNLDSSTSEASINKGDSPVSNDEL
jgi:uncharacterized protein YegL